MMNRWKHKLPTREKIFESRLFKPFARWFDDEHFWAFERESIARAVAIGLFCGMMPTPTQFAFAFLFAYLARVHLPVALFSTLYTNPLTLVPLYILAYEIGFWLLHGSEKHADLVMPQFGSEQFWHDFGRWAAAFGTPLAVGVLLMGSILAVLGYFVVQFFWRRHERNHPHN